MDNVCNRCLFSIPSKHVSIWRANSLQTCLPPVFVPFTHTNLGLPTRVCHLKFAVWRPLNTSGRCLPVVWEAWSDQVYFYSTVNGMLVHRKVTPALNSPVPIYTPGWREVHVPWVLSILLISQTRLTGLIFFLVDAICSTGSRKTLEDGCTISDDCSKITCKIDFVDEPITLKLKVTISFCMNEEITSWWLAESTPIYV